MYRCEAASLEGFIQQLAVSYIGNGYFFYVTGRIPDGKDVHAVDAKLIGRYEIDLSKWARARRKQSGQANMQYIRYGREFVLLATHGRHRYFEEETGGIRDARRVPVKVGGYSVSYRGGHPHVRIGRRAYKELKAYFVELGLHRGAEAVGSELEGVPFERYAPVRRQLLNILRAVNRARKTAGFCRIGHECLRFRRRIVRPFGGGTGGDGGPRGAAAWQREGEDPILSEAYGRQEAWNESTQGRDEEGAVYGLAARGHDRGSGETPG